MLLRNIRSHSWLDMKIVKTLILFRTPYYSCSVIDSGKEIELIPLKINVIQFKSSQIQLGPSMFAIFVKCQPKWEINGVFSSLICCTIAPIFRKFLDTKFTLPGILTSMDHLDIRMSLSFVCLSSWLKNSVLFLWLLIEPNKVKPHQHHPIIISEE